MASPFSLFRRHQKVLMVVLTGLAMFAFIVMDSLSRMNDASAFWPLITAAVGAAAFWFAGQDKEKSGSFVLVGAACGAAIGFIMVYTRSGPEGISTSIGTITQQQIAEMQQDRINANSFILGAVRQRKDNSNGMEYQFGDTSFASMIQRHLLLDKADKLNVQVSDVYIRDYIGQASEKGLSNEEYNELRNNLNLGTAEVFRLLRDELRVRLVMNMLAPRPIELPQEKWENFKKFEVSYDIDAIEIPVEPFQGDPNDSSIADGELEPLFNEFKAVYPDGPNPGFRKPRKVRLAWLRINRPEIEALADEPTEEELKTQYEEDKDVFYKALPDADDDLNLEEFNPPGSGKSAPVAPSAPEKIEAPETPDEAEKPGNDDSNADSKSSDENADKNSVDKGESEESSCEPQDEESANESSDENGEKKGENEEKPGDSNQENGSESSDDPPLLKLPNLEEGVDEKEEGEKSTVTTEGENSYQSFESVREKVYESVKSRKGREKVDAIVDEAREKIGRLRRQFSREGLKDEKLADAIEKAARKYAADTPGVYYFQHSDLVTYQDLRSLPEEEDDETSEAATLPEIDSSGEKESSEEEVNSTPEEGKEAKKPTSSEENEPESSEGSSTSASSGKSDESSCQDEPQSPSNEKAPENEEEEAPPKLPLLPETNTDEKEEESGKENSEAGTKPSETGEDSKAEGEPKETEVVEGEPTEPEEEKRDPSLPIENEIGVAQGGQFNFQERRMPTVAENVFSTTLSLFFPESADGSFQNDTQDYRYVYWGIAEQSASVPEEMDEETKTKVREAYVRREARPKAKARADAIVEHVKSKLAEKTLTEALTEGDGLGKLTVTGSEDSNDLQVLAPPAFSTLTMSGMSPNPFMSRPELSQIEGIEGVTQEFLESIAKMESGDVQVLTNFDQSAFIVVHLKSRTPEDTSGPFYEAAQRTFEQELRNPQSQFKYFSLSGMAAQNFQASWLRGLMQEYNVDLAALQSDLSAQ